MTRFGKKVRRKIVRSPFVRRSILPRFRRTGFRVGQRILGRELSYLDFDRLVERGVVEIGRHSKARPQVHYSEARPEIIAKVRIGSFTGVSPLAVCLVGSEHRTDWITQMAVRYLLGMENAAEDGPFTKGDIVIGNDVWIGHHAILLSGVTIGHGAVVGAGAVVAKDVRPYAIVVGNPAREIRRRFSDTQIEALEKIAWWDWPDEEIARHADLLSSSNIDDFIQAFLPQAGRAT